MLFKKKHQKILLVHSQSIEKLGGAELGFQALVSSAPAGVTFEVVLPGDFVSLKRFDTILLGNLRPSGGKGEKSEYRWALEWVERLEGYRGYVIRLEQDCHPCTFRDARCIDFDEMNGRTCDCVSPIPGAFEALYNSCDAIVYLSPLHRKVINQIIDVKVVRQFDIAPQVDFEKFRSITPFEERKKAALITGDELRIAVDAVALADAEGYPVETIDYLSVPYGEMPGLLNQYQAVVVAPAMLHAFSRLVVEAMACGCKVLTNNRVGAMSYADPVGASRNANKKLWKVINQRPLWPHRRWFARGKMTTKVELAGRSDEGHTSSSSSDSTPGPRITLTHEQARNIINLLLGRNEVSSFELEKAVEGYRTVSAMTQAIIHSREFGSRACRKRLGSKLATGELINLSFELLFRRQPENPDIVTTRLRNKQTHLQLVQRAIESKEAVKKASEYGFFANADFNSSPKTIFLHIPKTAGMSFYGLAKKIYPNKASFNTTGKVPEQEFMESDIVGGHFQYSVYEQMTGQRLFLALVRDPIERAISNFNYFRNRENNRKKRIQQKFDHDDFKKTIRESPHRTSFINNLQCRYLSDGYDFASVKSAFARDVFIVGQLSNVREWLSLVGDRLGWSDLELPRKNAARDSDYFKQFLDDDELIEILRVKNQEDYALFDFIKEQGVYESKGSGFDYTPFRIG